MRNPTAYTSDQQMLCDEDALNYSKELTMGTKRSDPFDRESDETNTKRTCADDLRAKCHCCGDQIKTQYSYKILNRAELHPQCMKCSECNCQLTEKDTCLMRNGKIYCKQDYVRNFSVICNRCKRPFSDNDFVIRSTYHVYHLACFQCDICQRSISAGSEYAPINGKIYCLKDFEVVYNQIVREMQSSQSTELSKRDKKVHQNTDTDDDDDDANVTDEDIDDDPVNENVKSNGRKEKATRVRTVLNENQLYTLRACYASNPRPDALMKEQLVEMTGLSPRVIRVWFQNKRCKDKKKAIMMKQMEENGQLQVLSESDIPLIASGPIHGNQFSELSLIGPYHHHEAPLNITPIRNPWFIQPSMQSETQLDPGYRVIPIMTRPMHLPAPLLRGHFRQPQRPPQFAIQNNLHINRGSFQPVGEYVYQQPRPHFNNIMPTPIHQPVNYSPLNPGIPLNPQPRVTMQIPSKAANQKTRKRKRKKNEGSDDDPFDPFNDLPPM